MDDENFVATTVHPNPFTDVISISSNSSVKKVSVADVWGKTISVLTNGENSIKEINLESLSNDMYFLTLEGTSNQRKTMKIIKE